MVLVPAPIRGTVEASTLGPAQGRFPSAPVKHIMPRKPLLALVAAPAVLLGHTASAALLGLYDFSEFTQAQANAYHNVGPTNLYQNHATPTLRGVASGLYNPGIASLVANQTRDGTGGYVGPVALLMGANGVANGNPSATNASNLRFTVSAGDSINFDSLTFDLGTSAGASSNSGGFTSLETRFRLYYSFNGTSFTALGPARTSVADNAAGTGAFTGMNAYAFDLTSLSLAPGGFIEFRLAFSDNDRGGGTTSMGHYLDNLRLTTAPEPTSAALAGLGVWFLAGRRRPSSLKGRPQVAKGTDCAKLRTLHGKKSL